jgi:serine phosphatase RsbU (regulator of sigma subunit)
VSTKQSSDSVGRPGTVLGVLDTVTTTTTAIEVRVGDVAVLYTDGITDLPPPYGIEAAELGLVVHGLRDLPTADDIAAGLQRSLLERVPDRSRQDDVAQLVIRIR